MLCQLVCIDRRYQRMNCFNIRELQGILKRRFFTDLVNTSDFRTLLDESMVGIRYKTEGQHSITPNSVLFYNYGLTTTQQHKTSLFKTTLLVNNKQDSLNTGSIFYKITSILETSSISSSTQLTYPLFQALGDILRGFTGLLSLNFYTTAMHSLNNLINSTWSILCINTTPVFMNLQEVFMSSKYNLSVPQNSVNKLTTENMVDISQSTTTNNLAESSDFRFTRFSNALINYDFKCGNYIRN